MAELRCIPHKIPRKMASDRAGAGKFAVCSRVSVHVRARSSHLRVVMCDVMRDVLDLEVSACAAAFGGGTVEARLVRLQKDQGILQPWFSQRKLPRFTAPEAQSCLPTAGVPALRIGSQHVNSMSTHHSVSCFNRGLPAVRPLLAEFARGMFEMYALPSPKLGFTTGTFGNVRAATPKPQRVKLAAGICLMCCPRRSFSKNAASFFQKCLWGVFWRKSYFKNKCCNGKTATQD